MTGPDGSPVKGSKYARKFVALKITVQPSVFTMGQLLEKAPVYPIKYR